MAKSNDADDEKNLSDTDRVRSVVENSNEEDESDENEDDEEDKEEDSAEDDSDEDDSEDDSEDDDEEEDDSDSDDDKDKSKKTDPKKPESKSDFKYKKYADDDPVKHIQNLEKAYESSSSEAINLTRERDTANRRITAIVQAAAKDPEFAKSLQKVIDSIPDAAKGGDKDDKSSGPAPTDNPFTVDAQTRWREKSQKEVQAILDANPEIATDPELGKQVKEWMDFFADKVYQKEGKLLSGGEAMEMAMRHLGIEDKREKQKTAKAAKSLAAPTRPHGNKKPSKGNGPKKPVSEQAYDFGSKMGVSRETIDKYS